MKCETYNLKENKKGSVTIDDAAFGLDWNEALVHQSLVTQESNSRQKIAHTKGTGEVQGGGRKPWRQKGTGRARAGTIRSAIWKGGGTTFGPRIEKKYGKKLNKKMKTKALFSALSKKLEEKEVYFVESLKLENYKTKEAKNLLDNLSQYVEDIKGKKVLFVSSSENKQFAMAIRNIKNAQAIRPESLNIQDLLSFKYIIFDRNSIKETENHFLNKS